MAGTRIREEIEKQIGDRVRFYRMRKQLSQDYVAKRLGLTFQQIQKYEKGTNRISVTTMLKLCEILDATPYELLGYKGTAVIDSELFENPEAIKLARLWSEMPQGVIYTEMAALIRTMTAIAVKNSKRARRRVT